jgi:3-deoxy-D-manno-octulosonic-acid transferase
MRSFYNLLVRLAAPLAFGLVLARGIRDRGYWQGLRERFGYGPQPGAERSIWLHAVSLGEVSAAAPIVHALSAHFPGIPIVVTTATPTGRARAVSLFADRAIVRFLPYDLPGAVARFLGAIRPMLAVIMETELWPNLFRECARRDLPVVLASARLSAKSVLRYRRFGELFSGLFTANVWVAAQTTADAQRFEAIGADPLRIEVIGNVKFDIDIATNVIEQGLALRQRNLGVRPVWAAGSTHDGEDQQVLEAHAQVCANLPIALLIIAPRHPQRFDAVAALLERGGWRYVRRSAGVPVASDVQVLLLDTVGELLAFYGASDVAFVGGSLVEIGGHNLLEPAALKLPVLTGPSDFNAKEIAALLVESGAARRVADAAELGTAVSELLGNSRERLRMGAIARRAVETNRGSVQRLLKLIETNCARAPAAPAAPPDSPVTPANPGTPETEAPRSPQPP